MRIVKLEASNVKRIKAVSITPDGNVITIGGKNRAGKSSVLDTIAFALGGKELIPEEPIRTGESEAVVKVDLGDLLVTRKFTREVIDKDGATVFGETKSTLTVKSKDGATYPSPQAMLDKLLGDLTFEPREFAMGKPKAQLETLRKITNLDTSIIDEQRRDAVARRSGLKKQVDQSAMKLNELAPMEVDVPVDEVSTDDIVGSLARIEGLRTKANEAGANAEAIRTDIAVVTRDIEGQQKRVESLRTELLKAEEQMNKLVSHREARLKVLEDAIKVHQAAVDAVPSTDDITKKLTETEELNAKVRRNNARRKAQKAHDDLVEKVEEESALIKVLDQRKEDMIAAVKFPVEGLGFGEEGVLLNGLPFEQASTSEQMAVSVAIGLTLNPKIRVLLVRNGESLDSDSMKALAELAEKHDAQLWVERMTESREGVSVMIEDGSVAPA